MYYLNSKSSHKNKILYGTNMQLTIPNLTIPNLTIPSQYLQKIINT
jgi:hypothetical protein